VKSKETDDKSELLELADLDNLQELRVIPSERNKFVEILVPFDKIGHEETIHLIQTVDMSRILGLKGQTPSVLHKVKLNVSISGTTKTLRLEDAKDPVQELTIQKDEPNIQMWEISLQSITASLIHKKQELATIFASKLHSIITNSDE